jgi:TrwC relaxase
VVADIAKLSIGREAYYTRELATDHEQYLSGDGESPGRWYGAGAASLGLQGEASPAGFQRMFEGRHPDTGELLGRAHGRNAVPAFDVVLRPTKSVSILYGLGDPATGRAVLGAHHAGVREAVGYLDDYLGARRDHGGHQHVDGRGLLAVGFDHRTSRAGDPLLHTHLVVANRVQGRTDAGRPWTAGTSTGIGWPPTPSTAPVTNESSPGPLGWSGHRPTATAAGSSRGCPRSCCAAFPSAPTRSTWRSCGWRPQVGSGHPGWLSGPSTPPANPSNTS